jgi:hypothetical protein
MRVGDSRNAVVGWVALAIGKRVLKRKTRAMVPRVDRKTRRPNKSAVTVGLLGALGVVALSRRRSSPPAGD